ncbi:unnamed protein product, partial [Effrenium voratum]
MRCTFVSGSRAVVGSRDTPALAEEEAPPGPSGHHGRDPPAPVWNGAKPETEFQVYENNVRLWEFETEAEEKKRGVKLLWSLSGNARAVADTLEFEDVAREAGVKNITKLLREHLAPHLETSLPRAFEAAVYSLWTTGQQSSSKEEFQEYLIRMENNFNKLRKEGVSLPEQAEGYTIYRQAALFENPDMRVTIWTESRFERGVIVAALGKFDKVVKEPRKKAAFHQGCENYVYLQDGDSDQVFEEEEVMSATISRRTEALESVMKYQREEEMMVLKNRQLEE